MSRPQALTAGNLGAAARLRSLLSAGPLTRGAATVALGHASAYGVMLLATPLLTRLYTPDDFGLLGAFTASLSLLGVSVCFCYESAIPLPKSDRGALRLLQLSVSIACVVALAWSLAVPVVAEVLAGELLAGLAPWSGWLGVNLAAYGAYQALTFWAIRHGDYRMLARLRLLLVATTLVVQLTAGWLGASPLGLIAGQVLGYTAAVVVGSLAMRGGLMNGFRVRSLAKAAWRRRRFPMYKVGSETLNVLQTALPPLAILGFFTPYQAGLFLLAWRVIGGPLTMLVVPIARVYLSRASQIGACSPLELRDFFVRTLLKALLVAGPVVAAVAIAAPWVFPIAFGADWSEAGRYCQYVCPMLLCHLLAISVRSTFDVLGRQNLLLVSSLLSSALLALCLAAPSVTTITPASYILLISGSGSLGYLACVWLCWMALRSETDIPSGKNVEAPE